jgi:hypothetical protein
MTHKTRTKQLVRVFYLNSAMFNLLLHKTFLNRIAM